LQTSTHHILLLLPPDSKQFNTTSITFHWVKGHVGLKGNERADCLAKIAASYFTAPAYGAIPIYRGKQILEVYCIKLWNTTYIHSVNAHHTKLFIPTIFHRLSLPLWPKFILTQFLTNHISFGSCLHKMDKTISPTYSCPEMAVKTAHHLMTECSLFSSERPTVLQTLPPLLVVKYYINTVGITSFLRNIFHTLQEQLQNNVLTKLLTTFSKAILYISFNLCSTSVNSPWYACC